MPKRIVTKKDPRHAYRKRVYGLSPEAYEQMRQIQDGKCAICKKEKPLVVDHSHQYGHVRSLICSSCNVGIGMLKEDVAILESAIDYLKRHWAIYKERTDRADAALDDILW